MMEIYQEQHGDEEAEEEQEVENFKRRISRPKIQFSPVPEIKKRILKKPKFKLNMSIRLNTGQTLNPFINDSSTSAYTSRENSFLDEQDFVGFDRLTQRELREQLGRIKPRNFLLPHYKNLRTVLENGSDSLSDNYLNNNRFFLDSSLDEQEEIHLLEPTRVEEEDNFFGTSQHEILENSRITAGMASIATKTPTHSHGNNLLDYRATTSTSSIQLSKLQTSESSESTKRMRKPAKLTDDFVYTPLIRQKQDVPVKSPAKRVFKIKQPKVTQLTESSDVSIQEEGPGTSQKPTAVLIGSPRKKKILGRKFEPKKRLPVLPYLLGNRKKPGRPKGVKQHEFIAPTQPGTSAGNDLLMTIGKMHLGPRMSNHLFDQQVIMTSESDSSASTQKRMRKPAHLTEDFVYTPLTKQQKQDAALKLKQKALKFKQPVPPLKIKRPPPKKHFPLPDTVEQQISHPEEPMEQEKPIRKKIHFKPLVPEIPQIHLEFFERMHLRKLLNPFSIGIRRRERFAADDYFYREIFVRDYESPPHVEASEEEEIDCVGLPTQKCDQDELMTGNPADESAAAIVEALQKDMTIQPIDIETPNEAEETFEEILAERINAVEPITREFLRILFKHIKEQRHVDIVSLGLTGGASIFHSLTMKNANRLRESLKLYSKSSQQAILVAHCWLLKNIPKCFIASYLNLLRFLRAAGSSLTDHIIGPAEDEFIAEANSYIRDFVRHKIYEPPMNPTFKPIEGAPLPNVSLILVYPQISAKTCKHITRAHETLFRHLLPLVVCCVEKVELIFDIDRPLSVEECAWLAIRLIRKRVREIVKRRPNDHIFLAGWGTTCWLNHKVTMFVPGVSGLLDFAFPTESACGSRGSVDDEICLTYPSTLFIVGENAANVKMASMQNLRRNMLTDSGLIVLGAANHNLLVSQARLSVERVTQFVVQRTIVEYTVQFVKQIVADLGPSRDCRELLKPIKLPNIYEVDGTFLKAPAPTRPRKTAAEKRQQNGQNSVAKNQQQQPRTLIAPDQPSTSAAAAASAAVGVGRPSGVGYSRPTKMASHLPLHLQPVIPASSSRIPTNIYSARASFSGSLKNSQQQQHHFMAKKMSMDVPISSASTSASSTIKIPSPEELNRQFQQAASATIPSTTSTAPNIALLQETIQEEEEAAAALSLLK